MMDDLFAGLDDGLPPRQPLAPGATLLRGFALPEAGAVLAAVKAILRQAPFRAMHTPGGRPMSVTTTSAGALGWTSDHWGYRYLPRDPDSGQPWPPLSLPLLQLARSAASEAGYPGFDPDACLINRYAPGSRMSLHQDRDEADLQSPIVAVSFGLPAVFLFGGLQRSDPAVRVPVQHGDVVVWGGPARLCFHGVMPIAPGRHPITGECRLNLSFRRAGRS